MEAEGGSNKNRKRQREADYAMVVDYSIRIYDNTKYPSPPAKIDMTLPSNTTIKELRSTIVQDLLYYYDSFSFSVISHKKPLALQTDDWTLEDLYINGACTDSKLLFYIYRKATKNSGSEN